MTEVVATVVRVASETEEYICPACSGTLTARVKDHDQFAVCPHCQGEVTIAAVDLDPENTWGGSPMNADDELDLQRALRVSTLRRALDRSRSHAIIATIVCAVAIVQLCFSTYQAFRARAIPYAVTYIVLGVVAAIGARYFYRRADALHREAMRSPLDADSQSAPDFSTLSDGSQRARNLDDMG